MPDSLAAKAPAGRRHFWITVFCFALVNLAAWVGYHQYAISRMRLLRIVKFEPGHEALVGPRPTFAWEFNLAVARPDGLNDRNINGDGKQLPSLMSVPFSEACD